MYIEQQLDAWMRDDLERMKALQAHRELHLPDSWLAAGFVRNLAWDRLHGFHQATPLNDVDVIYYQSHDLREEADLTIQNALVQRCPDISWEVKNQARMHLRNHDRPYDNALDAMHYWPEKETACAVRLADDGTLEWSSAFGLQHLFDLTISHNPNRQQEVFLSRIAKKQWLKVWPKLSVVTG
ncbi:MULTISPECIES: nucleotidyltransferase family protein [Vibrio]|nr:nucleotidyltransferase family protein [Vibrio nitrifigilis]